MRDKQTKAIFNRNLMGSFLVMIINVLFILRVIERGFFFEDYLMLVFIIFMDLFFLAYLRVTFGLREKRTNPDNHLSKLVGELEFLEPINIEQISKAPSEQGEPPEESSDDHSKAQGETDDKETVDINEEESMSISKPKEVIEAHPLFDSAIEPPKYCSALAGYMSDNGLSIDNNQIREIFAAMAASRVMILNNEHPSVSKRFVEVFSDFIGATNLVDELSGEVGGLADLFKEGFHFKMLVESAVNNPNTIHIMTLTEIDLKHFEEAFGKIVDFGIDPQLPIEVYSERFKMETPMPSNIWFALLPSRTDQPDKLSKHMAKSAGMIKLSAEVTEAKETTRQNAVKLTYEHLTNLYSEGFDEHFLEEVDWKKFDQIDDYFFKGSIAYLDNKLFRQLERYASAFMLFGGEREDAIDRVLFSKLLPLIKTAHSTNHSESKETVLTLFENLFGLENLSKSKAIMKEMELSS